MRKDDTSDESTDRASSRALQLMKRIESVGNGWLRQHYVRELGEMLVEGVCECEDVKGVIDEIEGEEGKMNEVEREMNEADQEMNEVDESAAVSQDARLRAKQKTRTEGAATNQGAKSRARQGSQQRNKPRRSGTAQNTKQESVQEDEQELSNREQSGPITKPSSNKVLLTFLKLIHTLSKDPKQEKRTCAHLLAHHLPRLIKLTVPPFTVHKPTDAPLYSTDQHNYYAAEQLKISDQKRMIRKTLGMETDMVRKDIVVENDIRMERMEVVKKRKRVDRRVEDVCTFFECLECGMVEMDWKEREGCFAVYCGIFEGMRVRVDESKTVDECCGENGVDADVNSNCIYSATGTVDGTAGNTWSGNTRLDPGTNTCTPTSALPYTHTISSSLLQTTVNILYNDKFSDYQSDRTSLPVRQAAAHLLSFIYQKDVLDQLFMFLDHPDWEVQCSALLALKSVQEYLSATDKKDVALFLLTLLESEDEDVKYMAADMLVHFRGVVGDVRVKMVVDEGVSRLGIVRMMECHCVRVDDGLSVDGCFRSEMVELRVAVLEYLCTMFRKGLVYDGGRGSDVVSVGSEDKMGKGDKKGTSRGKKGTSKNKNENIIKNINTSNCTSNEAPPGITIHHHYTHFINLLIQNLLVEETQSLTFLTFHVLAYYPINHVASYAPLALKPLNYVFKNTDFKNTLEMIDNSFFKGGVESMGREKVLGMRMRYFMYFIYFEVRMSMERECKDERELMRYGTRYGRCKDGYEDGDNNNTSNDNIINASNSNTSTIIGSIPFSDAPLTVIQAFLLSVLYKTTYRPTKVPFTTPQIKQNEWNEKLRCPSKQSVFHVVNEHFLDLLRYACFNEDWFYNEWLAVEDNDWVVWWYVYFLVRDGKGLLYGVDEIEKGVKNVGEDPENKNGSSTVKNGNRIKKCIKDTGTDESGTAGTIDLGTLQRMNMSVLIPSIIQHANASFLRSFFKHLNTNFYKIENHHALLRNTSIRVLSIVAQHIKEERIVCDRIIEVLYDGEDEMEEVVRLVDQYMFTSYGERIVSAVLRRGLNVRMVHVFEKVRFNEWFVLLVRPLLRFISLKDSFGGSAGDRRVDGTADNDEATSTSHSANTPCSADSVSETVTAGYKLFSNIVPYIQTVKAPHARIATELSVLSVLTNRAKLPKIEIRSCVTLRKYQVKGVYWLNFLYLFGINGILADEMGLGKTVQVLVFLFSKIDEIMRRSKRIEDGDGDENGDKVEDGDGDEDKVEDGDEDQIKDKYMDQIEDQINTNRDAYVNTTNTDNEKNTTLKTSSTHPSTSFLMNHKILIVCPGSLTGHWCNEIKKISKKYEGRIYTRKENVLSFITVISYDTYRHAHKAFTDEVFFYVVFDEGHILRNVDTVLYQKISVLRALNKLILSGTPVQNSINDLFALFNLLMPCYLGDKDELKERERNIRKGKDKNCGEEDVRRMEKELRMVRRRVGPFVLRRCKKDVVVDLPDKIVKDLVVVMGDEQREVYDWLVSADRVSTGDNEDERVRGGIVDSGARDGTGKRTKIEKNNGAVPTLNTPADSTVDNAPSAVSYRNISAFKKAKDLIKCCSSASYIRENVKQSCKMDALRDLYDTLNRTDSRILIFCQLKKSIRLIIDRLSLKNYLILDGQTRDKSNVVKKFMTGEYKTLLLTTSTGSLGLNLCIADTVIFFEHDYNPFNDLQAMDRAHRIGQRRTVSVYRLIVKDTVEERIMNLQEFKKFVAGSVIKRGTGEFGGDVSGESGVEGIY